MQMRSIEIDLDVHKVIESARVDFAEKPNAVLRRLLGIARGGQSSSASALGESPQRKPWVVGSIELPHGTKLRMTYNGETHAGEIVDGRWVVNGIVYSSPSAAAVAVARTRRGTTTRLNGWSVWEVQRPSDSAWVRIDDLRPKATVDDLLAILDLDEPSRAQGERWVDDVLTALHKLGGSAELPVLYRKVREIRSAANRSWPENAESAIRQTLQAHCAESSQYQGATDLFRNPSRGLWSIR